jgi:hypothetical protein
MHPLPSLLRAEYGARLRVRTPSELLLPVLTPHHRSAAAAPRATPRPPPSSTLTMLPIPATTAPTTPDTLACHGHLPRPAPGCHALQCPPRGAVARDHLCLIDIVPPRVTVKSKPEQTSPASRVPTPSSSNEPR